VVREHDGAALLKRRKAVPRLERETNSPRRAAANIFDKRRKAVPRLERETGERKSGVARQFPA